MGLFDDILNNNSAASGTAGTGAKSVRDNAKRIRQEQIDSDKELAQMYRDSSRDFREGVLRVEAENAESEKERAKSINDGLRQQVNKFKFEAEFQRGLLNRPFAEIAKSNKTFAERYDIHKSAYASSTIIAQAFTDLAKEYAVKLGIDPDVVVEAGFEKVNAIVESEQLDFVKSIGVDGHNCLEDSSTIDRVKKRINHVKKVWS